MRPNPRSGHRRGRPTGPAGAPRRDRRGRGLRGRLAPADIPVSRTRSQVFDELVLDAVEDLEQQLSTELDAVEFAVEDVPPSTGPGAPPGFDNDTVVDRGVALGQLHRVGLDGVAGPVIVLYRRPIESRAIERDERRDLVFMIVAELVAEFLGRDLDER